MKPTLSRPLVRIVFIVLSFLLIAILHLGCPIINNVVEPYTVSSIETGEFSSHNAIWIETNSADVYLILTAKSSDPAEDGNKNEWIGLKEGMILKVKLMKYEAPPEVDYQGAMAYKPLHRIIIENFPEGADQDSIESLDSTEYWETAFVYIENGKIVCPVYHTDDIIGTIVRKSAVVKGE